MREVRAKKSLCVYVWALVTYVSLYAYLVCAIDFVFYFYFGDVSIHWLHIERTRPPNLRMTSARIFGLTKILYTNTMNIRSNLQEATTKATRTCVYVYMRHGTDEEDIDNEYAGNARIYIKTITIKRILVYFLFFMGVWVLLAELPSVAVCDCMNVCVCCATDTIYEFETPCLFT